MSKEEQAFRKDFFVEACRRFVYEMRQTADELSHNLDRAIEEDFKYPNSSESRLDLAASFADAVTRIGRNTRIDLIITYAAQSVALDGGYDDITKD